MNTLVLNTTNRLDKEKSPYLLQHADNPVDWWPWCDEALAKAKLEDKPIFLSIGYSTCHWCHVMAHESFADAQVAELLNKWFVAIKVDREERPDIDAVYMRACQALTGSGGWPLTVIMTPEQRPFFTATYIPKNTNHGMLGMMELLPQIAQKWATSRQDLLAASEEITAFLIKNEAAKPTLTAAQSQKIIELAVQQFKCSFDHTWGGFGRAPKFPSAHNLLFLLEYASIHKDEEVAKMVEHTLTSMYRGGIFDHIGGGFSRYSTDKKWLIPHFEKMLYDNALLATAYLKAFEYSNQPLYAEIAERVLTYVLRELTNPDGGFYCSQDADSEGIEGKYYAFSPEEIIAVLGKELGKLFCNFYAITSQGNFEGKSIANLLDNDDYCHLPPELPAIRKKVYQYRLSRTSLNKDDKVLTSWNSLMINAMAQAGRILHDDRYTQAAQNAQQFIEHNLSSPDGHLFIRWREGEAAYDGLLDDYVFYGLSLLSLYQLTAKEEYLQRATAAGHIMLEQFEDAKQGGFYLVAKGAEQLIIRPKEIYDGAIPCGNSAAILLLRQLARDTSDAIWQKAADRQVAFMLPRISQYPLNHSFALLALLER